MGYLPWRRHSRRVMQYTILKHESLVLMVKHVEELMGKEGWTPLGGIARGEEYDDLGVKEYFYLQAMTRNVHDKNLTHA